MLVLSEDVKKLLQELNVVMGIILLNFEMRMKKNLKLKLKLRKEKVH